MHHKSLIKNFSAAFKNHATEFFVLLFFTFINFSPYFIFFPRLPNYDWDQFNALTYSIQLAIFKYHIFPLHDPYICGGADILANPQNYIFSPSIILNFLFSPYWSNLFSIMACAVFGGFGMIKLLRFFDVEKKLALIGALIFLSSNWFGLHFLEGHIAYRSMQLIPWTIYFIFCLEKNIKYWLYLSFLMAFFMLDGGMYAFNFSAFFLLIALCLQKPQLSNLIKILCQNRIKFILILAAFLGLILPKILPVFLLKGDRFPELHFYTYSFYDSFLAFFYPLNLLTDQKIIDEFEKNLRMHEYACYLGFTWLPLFFLTLKKNYDKTIFAFLLVCLWIGIGFGYLFNPWTIFMAIPFLDNAHVQSRFLIFFFVFFTILIVKAAAKTQHKYLWLTLILLELTCVKIYPLVSFLEKTLEPSTEYIIKYSKREIAAKIEEVPKSYDLQDFQGHNILLTSEYSPIPQVYFTPDKASKYCYDKSGIATNVLSVVDENYFGEFYSLCGDGKISVQERSADKIVASYSGKVGETIIFNTNYLLGWKKQDKNAYEVKSVGGLLAVKINQPNVEMVLKYQPKYLRYVILSFVFSLILYLMLFMKMRRKP